MKQRDIVNFFGDIRERVQPPLSMSAHQDLLTSLLQLLYKPKHNHEDVLNVSHVLCQLVTNGAHECIIKVYDRAGLPCFTCPPHSR